MAQPQKHPQSESDALNKSQLSFLDFMVNCFPTKLFTSSNMQTIESCHLQSSFKLPSEQIVCRYKKYASSEVVSMNLANFSCV